MNKSFLSYFLPQADTSGMSIFWNLYVEISCLTINCKKHQSSFLLYGYYNICLPSFCPNGYFFKTMRRVFYFSYLLKKHFECQLTSHLGRGTSVEKVCSPNWLVSKPGTHFLDWLLIDEGPGHGGQCTQEGSYGWCKTDWTSHEEQASSHHPASPEVLPWLPWLLKMK